MWKTPRARLAPSSLLLVLLAVLAPGLAGCSDDSDGQGAPPSSGPSDTATGAAPSLRQRGAPYELRYRKVAGDIRDARGHGTLRAVSKPVRAWIDAGFVQGPWPREAFGEAFVPFGRNITDTARRDAGLLTLQSVGGSFVEVVPQRRTVGVSVTGVDGHVVGATARVDLRVLGVSRAGERTRVNVRGDLFLTRVPERGWKIFGYQLDRWVEQGAMTRAPSKAKTKANNKGGA